MNQGKEPENDSQGRDWKDTKNRSTYERDIAVAIYAGAFYHRGA